MPSDILRKRIISFLVILLLVFGWVCGAAAAGKSTLTRQYGEYLFTKVSNPSTGSGKPDGINTNDVTGYPANRLNSYAWAVASRGDYIYIGTNRTLFGSALNAVTELVQKENAGISPGQVGNAVRLLSGGDVPVNLADQDYIPQIIRFDVRRGRTKVIFRPGTAPGKDGRLYYTDRDGKLIPDSDVSSEAASFRSVIEYKGNLYFGSIGSSMLQLIRIDAQDHAEVVYQSLGRASSLRACAVHDPGDGEQLFFGGQDGNYLPWQQYQKSHPDERAPQPIVIRSLDPETAGTDHEDWSSIVADFRDFGKYSFSTVYISGGGNVWDLCSYNGRLYLVLACDGGWALFRGEKGGSSPNSFGWTWTEIVGDNGRYPLAMDSRIAGLNLQYARDYGCSNYAAALTGTGLLESAATPYVYNGKMYLGSFDNATCIQSQTVIKTLVSFRTLKNAKENGAAGPTLTQIYAPIYEVLSHPQHIWVMDRDESIQAVNSANALLNGTTNDYVWRFIEHEGKLYTGTFDASTAYIYFLNPLFLTRMLSNMRNGGNRIPVNLEKSLDGIFAGELRDLLEELPELSQSGLLQAGDSRTRVRKAAVAASEAFDSLWKNGDVLEKLLEKMKVLKTSLGGIRASDLPWIPKEAGNMIDWLVRFADPEGLEYWIKARKLATQAETGFDILVTDDGVNWQKITGDGLRDRYNYGARTFTIFNGELYVGTANPYYGAQLWKLRNVTAPLPVPKTGDSGNPFLWAGLLLLGLLGLAAAGRMNRSRRHIRKKAEQEEEKKT